MPKARPAITLIALSLFWLNVAQATSFEILTRPGAIGLELSKAVAKNPSAIAGDIADLRMLRRSGVVDGYTFNVALPALESARVVGDASESFVGTLLSGVPVDLQIRMALKRKLLLQFPAQEIPVLARQIRQNPQLIEQALKAESILNGVVFGRETQSDSMQRSLRAASLTVTQRIPLASQVVLSHIVRPEARFQTLDDATIDRLPPSLRKLYTHRYKSNQHGIQVSRSLEKTASFATEARSDNVRALQLRQVGELIEWLRENDMNALIELLAAMIVQDHWYGLATMPLSDRALAQAFDRAPSVEQKRAVLATVASLLRRRIDAYGYINRLPGQASAFHFNCSRNICLGADRPELTRYIDILEGLTRELKDGSTERGGIRFSEANESGAGGGVDVANEVEFTLNRLETNLQDLRAFTQAMATQKTNVSWR